MQHDRHLSTWLLAHFNLTIEYDGHRGFNCWLGDYDLETPTGNGKTRFDAALDYAACHDGELFDKLNAIELGV